jgi:MFS family permease
VKIPFYLTEIKNQLILAHLQPLPFFSVLSHDGVYTELGYFRFRIPKGFSINAVFGIVFAFFIPVSALIADRIGRRKMLIMPQRPSLFLVLPFLFS